MSEERTIYIHYGDDRFRKMDPIRNGFLTKPAGGLWASRINDPGGWISWCLSKEFCLYKLKDGFTFQLTDNAKVLELNDIKQLDDLPKLYPYNRDERMEECFLDFEEIAKEYDAIELTEEWKFHWALYGWDCNCIVILNPDCVVNVQSIA